MSKTEIDRSIKAKASSAHSRINLALNIHSWDGLPEDHVSELLWFHQHLLDEQMDWDRISKLLPKKTGNGFYDHNTIYKVLKGIHEASYDNIVTAISSYHSLWDKKSRVKHAAFIENSNTRAMFAAFDYALNNNRMQLVIGNSGMGKTTAQKEWARRIDGGRCVYVDCPPFGGNKGFLRSIATKVGVNQALPTPDMLRAVVRGFSPSRILLLDNMHRVVPSDTRSKAIGFDILQYLFEASGCAIGITATVRLDQIMQSSSYIYDQFEGRIGKPIYLTKDLKDSDWLPIVQQFIANPSAELINVLRPIANGAGRLHQLCGTLEDGGRIARKKKTKLEEKHILLGIKARADLSEKTAK